MTLVADARCRLMEERLIGEAAEPARNYDLLSVIMLCLSGPDVENYGGVLRMLDVLLSNETSEAEKRKILQDDYDIQMTQAMEKEVSVMCNLSKGVGRICRTGYVCVGNSRSRTGKIYGPVGTAVIIEPLWMILRPWRFLYFS